MFTEWLKVRMSDVWRVDRRGFGIKQDFIPLFFFMYVQILWQGQKAVFTIAEFECFDIFYSKFELVSTFSVCKFCVENCLLCCDLSSKWVRCRSGCKRFWKWALHILCIPLQLTCVPIMLTQFLRKTERYQWLRYHSLKTKQNKKQKQRLKINLKIEQQRDKSKRLIFFLYT